MWYDPQKHHRHSIRLKGYDYSQEGLYFITLCCQNRACLFGEIKNGQMILNDAGRIVEEEWIKTPQIRRNTELGEFVVMPNHFHAILEIKYCVEGELKFAPTDNKFKSPSQTIGAIIRGFKGASTKRIKELINQEYCTGELKFAQFKGVSQYAPTIWQRNYWEHIIRNQQEYERIANYIINNPAKWKADQLNKPSEI